MSVYQCQETAGERRPHYGVASIGGSRTKVIEVVLDEIAYGWSPEEIHFQHPHLTLAQVHAARAPD
jgi:uncharacterized protein (DUF433 family)